MRFDFRYCADGFDWNVAIPTTNEERWLAEHVLRSKMTGDEFASRRLEPQGYMDEDGFMTMLVWMKDATKPVVLRGCLLRCGEEYDLRAAVIDEADEVVFVADRELAATEPQWARLRSLAAQN